MVDRYEYSQLISENQERTERIQQIKTIANQICERRRSLADHLISLVATIQADRSKVKQVIDNIKDSIGVIEDQAIINDIISICNDIESDFEEYESNTKSLSERFRNQKIKISSIGYRSQGKSNFTRLYSGLPDSIVAEKGTAEEEDKTGAINIIHHKAGCSPDNPEIYVAFKSRKEVLKRVNDFLSKWPVPVKGLRHIPSYQEFCNLKSEGSVYNEIVNYTGSFETSIQKGLLSYLSPDIDLSEVGNNPHKIEVSELPKYNDMQYDGSKSYSSVDKIDIYVDLYNDGLFENFEICDTKGSSEDAGGMIADKDIFTSINSSDAAFTIMRVGSGQGGRGFISNVLYPHYQNDIELIQNKHFVIINVDEKCAQVETVNNAWGDINNRKIAQAVYIGSFRNRPAQVGYATTGDGITPLNPQEPRINPSLFVDGVLLNMLGKIAISTKTNDDNLIAKINEKSKSINKLIQGLKTKLRTVQEFAVESEDILILEEVRVLRDKTYNQIHEMIVSEDSTRDSQQTTLNRPKANRGGFNYGQQPQVTPTADIAEVSYTVEQPGIIDYEELYKRQRSAEYSIFRLLTGESRDMTGKTNQSVKDEIEEAVRYIYKKGGQARPAVSDYISDSVSICRFGDTSDSGRYIECVSMMYSKRIRDNFNKKLVPQNAIEFAEDADNIYKCIWEGLKLNYFTGWGEYSREKLTEKAALNEQLRALLELFHNAYQDTTDPISLFTPFETLMEYFRRELVQGIKTAKHIETDIVVDDEALIKTLVDLIRVHNIPKMIIDKVTDKKRRVNNFMIQIIQELAPQTDFVQNMLPLYRLPEADPVFSTRIQERRALNEAIKQYNSSKDAVLALSNVTSLTIPA